MMRRSMRATGLVILLIAVAAPACKSKRESAPAPVVEPTSDSRRDAGSPPADAAQAVEERNHSPEEYARYRRHLHLGRAHAKGRRYGEAMREFDRALDVLPASARALSELGWAAFQAGDHERARSANQSALRLARNDALRAACLYNLGRLAEAQGDRDEALRQYRASLALRANDTVEARLGKLERKSSSNAVDKAASCKPEPQLESLCRCLAAGSQRSPATAAETPGSCHREPRGIPDVELLFVGDDTEESVHLVRKHQSGWAPLARLGQVFDSESEGTSEEFEIARFEKRTIGERTVLWIETVQTRTEETSTGKGGKGGRQTTRQHALVVCPWSADGRDLACALSAPLSSRRERTRASDSTPNVLTEYVVRVDVRDSGRASVILERGARRETWGATLGEHQLW